jgi:predicted dehydrogenase
LLVGLGQIGVGYDLQLDDASVYSHARAFDRHPAFVLAAGIDGEAARRAVFTQHYGAPAYATVEEALAAGAAVDVLVIAVPTPAHGSVLRAVLAARTPRAVLCEKPLADGTAEAQAMAALCRERDIALYANYMRRSDSAVIEVARRLRSGAIAGPVKGVCWYSKGLRHNGSHFVNLLEYWLGPLAEQRVLEAGRPWGEDDAEPDAQLRFERGTVTMLAAREEAFSHYTIELVAGNGRLRYEQGGRLVQWQPAVAGALAGYRALAAQAEELPTGMQRYQWHVAAQLAEALAGRPHVLCDGAAALATLVHVQRMIDESTGRMSA